MRIQIIDLQRHQDLPSRSDDRPRGSGATRKFSVYCACQLVVNIMIHRSMMESHVFFDGF